jgi:hypothetical protein
LAPFLKKGVVVAFHDFTEEVLGIKELTQFLPVVLAVFMGDAPQVFKK